MFIQAILRNSGEFSGLILAQDLFEELEEFVNVAVPEIPRRARLRTAYEQGILREQLGFSRPTNH